MVRVVTQNSPRFVIMSLFDFSDLASRIDYNENESLHEFLDLSTGQIVCYVHDNFQIDLDPLEEDEIQLHEYTEDEIIEEKIENNVANYLPLDHMDSSTRYQIMEEFTSHIGDKHIQQELMNCLQEKSPFRRFKDALVGYPNIRADWFRFEQTAHENYTLSWLDRNDIVLCSNQTIGFPMKLTFHFNCEILFLLQKSYSDKIKLFHLCFRIFMFNKFDF
jgi:hypothetical protein